MNYLKFKLNAIKEDMEEMGLYDGFGQVFIDCMILALISGILLFSIISEIYIKEWFVYIEPIYFCIFLGSFLFFAVYIALGMEQSSTTKRMCIIFAPTMLFFEFVLLENWYEMGLVLFIVMIMTIIYQLIKNIRKIPKETSIYSICVSIMNMLGDVILSIFIVGLLAFAINTVYDFYQLVEKSAQEDNIEYIDQENNNQNFYIVEEVQDERI